MKRALVLLIVSIGYFRRRTPGTSLLSPSVSPYGATAAASCAGSGCRLPQTWLRLRSSLLSSSVRRFALTAEGRCAACIILMLICSGCGQKQAAPLILNVPDCPAPAPPALPLIDGSAPLDAPDNVARLMERDDRMRAHIDGLNAALRCFQAGRTPHGNQ